MISRQVKIQLFVFALVTVLAAWYGAVRFLGVGQVIQPPYEVKMQVTDPAGLYPRADVDLLGTRVGRVGKIEAGPDELSTITLLIDHDVEIPADVRGVVGSKSAIGEGFIQLEPRSEGGPMLEEGDTIEVADTVSPPALDALLVKLDALAGSIPVDDLDVLLRESEKALRDIEPAVGRLIDGSQVLADDTLANIEDTRTLLQQARTVLGTQVDIADETLEGFAQLAQLTTRLRELDPTLVKLYESGVRASTGVTNLLADNQALLPVLLDNLITITNVAADRVQGLRKTLVVFPWVLELQVNTARFCDDYDPVTGEAQAETCHYDDEGNPIYALHLAQQGDAEYDPCNAGYEGTNKIEPQARPRFPKPNLRAHCGSSPYDPDRPNVRGSQNVTTPAYARKGAGPPPPQGTSVVYDPTTGLVTNGNASMRIVGTRGEAPPTGPAGLGWLLTSALEDQ